MWKENARTLQSSNPSWTYETDLGALLNIQLPNKPIPSGAHVHVQLRRPDSLPFGFKCIRFVRLLWRIFLFFFFCRKPAERTQPLCLAGDRLNQRQHCRRMNDTRLSHFIRERTTSHCGRMINPSLSPWRHICSVHTVATDSWETSVDLNVWDKHSLEFYNYRLLRLNNGFNWSVQWMDG